MVEEAIPPPPAELAPLIDAAKEDPTLAAIYLGVVLGLPAMAIYLARYAGYSGDLTPTKAFQILQTKKAVLVDIRTPEEV